MARESGRAGQAATALGWTVTLLLLADPGLVMSHPRVGDADIVPFVLLTFAGGAAAWAAQTPFIGIRRRIARGIALAWLVAAVWIGVLLGAYVAAGSGAPPTPDETYFGLPATIYHLVGLYGGLVFVLLLAFGRRPRDSPRLASTS